MSEAVKKLQRQRFEFLKGVYERSEGSKYQDVDVYSLGDEIDLSREQVDRAVEYLIEERLIERPHFGNDVAITHLGVVEAERAMTQPDQATDYFLPLNVIYAETITHSQIQQATQHSTQSISYDLQDVEAIADFIGAFRDRLPDLDLDKETEAQAQADLASLEAQVHSPNPRRLILRECLHSLRAILEGAAAPVATFLLQQLGNLQA
jgi:hypothetical protein